MLKNGFSHKTFNELSKRVFVKAASEMKLSGKSMTDSRIALLTGLTRRAVQQIKSAPGLEEESVDLLYNKAGRILFGWRQDSDFKDVDGEPLQLEFKSEGVDFMTLVQRYGRDVDAKVILAELTRLGCVKTLSDGKLSMLTSGYVPTQSEAEMYGIMGRDISDHLNTFIHNISDEKRHKFS